MANPSLFFVYFRLYGQIQQKLLTSAGFELGSLEMKPCPLTTIPQFRLLAAHFILFKRFCELFSYVSSEFWPLWCGSSYNFSSSKLTFVLFNAIKRR